MLQFWITYLAEARMHFSCLFVGVRWVYIYTHPRCIWKWSGTGHRDGKGVGWQWNFVQWSSFRVCSAHGRVKYNNWCAGWAAQWTADAVYFNFWNASGQLSVGHAFLCEKIMRRMLLKMYSTFWNEMQNKYCVCTWESYLGEILKDSGNMRRWSAPILFVPKRVSVHAYIYSICFHLIFTTKVFASASRNLIAISHGDPKMNSGQLIVHWRHNPSTFIIQCVRCSIA